MSDIKVVYKPLKLALNLSFVFANINDSDVAWGKVPRGNCLQRLRGITLFLRTLNILNPEKRLAYFLPPMLGGCISPAKLMKSLNP